MSLNIVPIEQFTAQLLAGLIIPQGQNGDAVKIVARGETALQLATVLDDIATGNAEAGLAAFTSFLQNPNTDPAVAGALQNLVQLGFAQLQIASNFNALIPFFGAQPAAVLDNIAKGMTAAANLEIAKYGTPPAATPPVTGAVTAPK